MKKFLLIGFGLLLAACTTVQPTEVGLKVSKAGNIRGVTKENIVSGYIFYIPWTTEVIQYPINVQTYTWSKNGPNGDESFIFQTAESVSLNADVSFSYHVIPDRAPEIYKSYGPNIDTITRVNIHNFVRDAITRNASQFHTDEILGRQRTNFEDAAKAEITATLLKHGFEVDNFAFVGEIRPPATVAAAIAAKFTAQQTAIQAQNKVVQATAEANQAIALAKGRAQSVLIEAQSQAQANQIIAKSITPELIQSKLADRWDGKVSQVQGSNAGLLLNLGVK